MRISVRRSIVLSFPLIALVGVACNPSDDSSTPQDDGGTIDAGTPFDGGGPTTPDGGAPVDGSAPPDGGVVGPGALTVKALHDDDSPEVGADVYFLEDGQPVFHTTTDVSGQASHGVGHATSVTVFHHVYAGYPDREIVTVMSAMPGDAITVGREGLRPLAYGDSFYADIPSTAAYTGATSYNEEAGDCIGAGTTQTMLPVHASFTMNTYCWKAGDAVNVLMSAYATSDHTVPSAYAVKTATPNSTTPTITFATGDWQAATSHSMAFSGTAPTTWAQTVSATVQFPDAKGFLYALQGNSVPFPGDITTLTFDYGVPPTIPVAVNATLSAAAQTGLSLATSALYRRAAPTDALAFDWSHLLPKVGAATASTSLTAPVVTWTSDAALTKDDVGVVQLQAAGGDAGGTIRWRIVFPVDGNTVTPPALATDVSAYVPGGAWTAKSITVSSGAATYAKYRQTPTATPQSLSAAGEVATTSNVLP